MAMLFSDRHWSLFPKKFAPGGSCSSNNKKLCMYHTHKGRASSDIQLCAVARADKLLGSRKGSGLNKLFSGNSSWRLPRSGLSPVWSQEKWKRTRPFPENFGVCIRYHLNLSTRDWRSLRHIWSMKWRIIREPLERKCCWGLCPVVKWRGGTKVVPMGETC